LQGSDNFPLHPLDLIPGIMLLYSMYRGYKSGFILVLVNSLALLLAVAMAYLFLDETRHFLEEYLEKGKWILSIAAFLLIFFLAFFGLKWFGSLMASTVRSTLLGPLDQAAGALLGLFRMAFILGSLLYGLEIIGIKIETQFEGKLWLLPLLRDMGPGCLNILSPLLPFLREILEKKNMATLL